PLWLGTGRAFHGSARAALGADADTVAEVMEGLALAGGTGSRAGAPGSFGLLAETHAAAGQYTEALGFVETGLAVSAQTRQHLWDAELHRLKGDLLLTSQRGSEAEAEALFRRALEIAR